jgi:cation diffusion facilitator family transporter
LKKQANPYSLTKKVITTTVVGIAISSLLAGVKIVTGILGNSYALIADGIESLSDIFTSSVVLSGLLIASKPPDANHPYGHGKAEPLAGAIVAIMLFFAAVIIIIQSVFEIVTPHHAPEFFTLPVLLAVVVTKELLFRYVIKVGKASDSLAVKNDAWHHRSDAITSAAAFIGISIALIGGKGYESADDYAALFASGIIILNGIRLLKPALMELMDTAPSETLLRKVRFAAQNVEGVLGLDKCFLRKMGLEYVVDLQIIVDRNISVFEGHAISHKVKDELIRAFPSVSNVIVHIEPSKDN